MALLALSDRQRGELEDIVSHTPWAKERCRAQALLRIADGSDVGAVAELLQVSRQTVYNWLSRFQEREEVRLSCHRLDRPAAESVLAGSSCDRGLRQDRQPRDRPPGPPLEAAPS
jgi:DNA-binding transcriptional ArsR family regulator